MKVPVYVISLARSHERRADISKRLGVAGIQHQITDRVEGNELDLATLPDRIVNSDMSPSAVGCFLSHYNLWQRMIDEKIPIAVILEDDAVVESDFVEVIGELAKVPWQWDVVNFCYEHRIKIDTDVCAIGASRRLVRNKRPTNSATGYAVRLDGAIKMTKYCYKIRRGVDVQRRQYYDYGLHFYSIDPPLGHQSGLPTTISICQSGKSLYLPRALARLYRKIRYDVYNRLHKPQKI